MESEHELEFALESKVRVCVRAAQFKSEFEFELALESGVELEFVLEIEFEFKAGFEIDLEIEVEFQFKFEIELELEFAFALEFGFKKLTFGPISIPRSLKFALRDLLDRSPGPPHSPTGECARRHPGKGPKMTPFINKSIITVPWGIARENGGLGTSGT